MELQLPENWVVRSENEYLFAASMDCQEGVAFCRNIVIDKFAKENQTFEEYVKTNITDLEENGCTIYDGGTWDCGNECKTFNFSRYMDSLDDSIFCKVMFVDVGSSVYIFNLTDLANDLNVSSMYQDFLIIIESLKF